MTQTRRLTTHRDIQPTACPMTTALENVSRPLATSQGAAGLRAGSHGSQPRRKGWRASLLTLVVLVASLPAGSPVPGAGVACGQGPVPLAADPLTEAAVVAKVEKTLDRSLKYLASKQLPDGGWHNNQAVNGLTVLAFLGRGHVPGRGPYAEVLENAKRAILRGQNAKGLFGGTMYEHGIATLAVSELYGMDPDPLLEERLRKAVALIVSAQSPAGGWRYNPTPTDQDLSVTVVQIVALRAANNAEIEVPAQVIDRAIGYIRACVVENGGGYGYQGKGGRTPQTTAAGIVSLQLLGQYDDPSIPPALEFLNKVPIEWKGGQVNYFYYFHYYAIQAQYQTGGESWNAWHPKIRELLFSRQNGDGSWDVPEGTAEQSGTVGPNKVYWTAMASLILEIYMHYLPAYQR